MTEEQSAAFAVLFKLADGGGSGARAARAFLCAWWSDVLGHLHMRDLWALDPNNMHAARIAMLWFMDRNSLEDTAFEEPMRALARREAESLRQQKWSLEP